MPSHQINTTSNQSLQRLTELENQFPGIKTDLSEKILNLFSLEEVK